MKLKKFNGYKIQKIDFKELKEKKCKLIGSKKHREDLLYIFPELKKANVQSLDGGGMIR